MIKHRNWLDFSLKQGGRRTKNLQTERVKFRFIGDGKRRNEFAERHLQWHGLRNDIIMRNFIYGKWRKEKNSSGKHARVSVAPFLAPSERAIDLLVHLLLLFS